MEKPRSKPLVIIQTYENRNKNLNGISERLSMTPQNQSEVPEVKSTTSQQRKTSSTSSIAPPPPPLPVENATGDKLIPPSPPKQKVKPPPPPVPQKTHNNSSNPHNHQPPPCPTPDYDSLSLTSNSTLPRKAATNGYHRRQSNPSQYNDTVEMESLESFKLNGTNEANPKPPNTYFNKTKLSSQLSNGSTNSTLTKQQKSVSVTIGGYPSGVNRKQPKKLDFLNGHDTVDRVKGESINSQFASELAQTLSRSNLRKRTESMENLLNHPQIKADKNGSVRISVNSSLGKHLAKSTNDLTNIDAYNKPFSNRVTICIPSNEKKCDAPNGILKNGNGNILSHRPVVQQKSITFGDMPTVINDQLHVT